MTSAAPSGIVEFRVRYAETDQMGVVYHANYLPWCEVGRTELIRQVWKPYARIEREDGIVLAVTDLSMRFHASARYDDLVRVTTTLEAVRSRAVAFSYLVERVDDGGGTTRLVSCEMTLTAVARDGGLRRVPAALIDAYRAATRAEVG